jgi:hypothetical protein
MQVCSLKSRTSLEANQKQLQHHEQFQVTEGPSYSQWIGHLFLDPYTQLPIQHSLIVLNKPQIQ